MPIDDSINNGLSYFKKKNSGGIWVRIIKIIFVKQTTLRETIIIRAIYLSLFAILLLTRKMVWFIYTFDTTREKK